MPVRFSCFKQQKTILRRNPILALRSPCRIRCVRVGALNVQVLWALLAVLLGGSGLTARAAVTLLLEQPYGGMSVINPTGHSAIYLDHVCAETPLLLRSCHAGELGAVISRYDDVDGFDWVAIPLLPYLYAVQNPEEIPASVDQAMVAHLRNVYRRAQLQTVAPDSEQGEEPLGNWYELVGSAYDRTIYGFQMNSTAEQDQRLIALLNDSRNVQRYNVVFRNCADFARVTMNRFYPHAIRRNLIADLGLTTPKSVARSLTRYAAKHPEVELRVFTVPQVPGSLPRSQNVQGVAESLFKRYGVPLTILSPVATGAVFVAYLGHGRFSMPHDATVLNFRDSPEKTVSAMLTASGTLQGSRTEVGALARESQAQDALFQAAHFTAGASAGSGLSPYFEAPPAGESVSPVSSSSQSTVSSGPALNLSVFEAPAPAIAVPSLSAPVSSVEPLNFFNSAVSPLPLRP